ncbi:hypothetical protein SteCoe_21482 [Stentor coeruleus]|uniref:Tyrosine-protein kinase ephrin type A/B receptor-like domain-containing protein n=1 Tax=Stentor coeruleus TaxID=5963 RepID=A0A1R2BQ05_9CILI|nr:hypothetical protein SteCoe_21482 [Stentor coeruleus]
MTLIVLLLSFQAFSFHIETIPLQGPPPTKIQLTSSVYDSYTSSIITIGGYNLESLSETINIYTFNLITFKWGEIIPESEYIPSGIQNHYLYLTSSREILLFFGYSQSRLKAEVLGFDLETYIWEKKKMSGDSISGRMFFSYCNYVYNGIRYLAIYGGYNRDTYDNKLYMYILYRIEPENLIAKKMTPEGPNPGNKDSAAFVFYENSLYLYGVSLLNTALNDPDYLFRYDIQGNYWEKISTSGNFTLTAGATAYICEDSMYVFFGIDPLVSSIVSRLNMKNLTWEKLSTLEEIRILGYTTIQFNCTIYLSFGRQESKTFNSIYEVNLLDKPIQYKKIFENYITPSKRREHCMFDLNNKLIIFGGVSSDGKTFYNDLWAYSVELKVWEELKTIGNLPLARASAVCIKAFGHIVIYGGYNDQGILDDINIFNLRNLKWSSITNKSGISIPIYGACATLGIGLYFISGITDTGLTKEIYAYDVLSSSLKKAINLGDVYINLAYHSCYIKHFSDHEEIYVLGGEGESGSTNTQIYKVVLWNDGKNYYYKISVVLNSYLFYTSRNPAVIIEDAAFVISGSSYNTMTFDRISILNTTTFESFEYKDLGLSLYSFGCAHLGKAIYIFGGGEANGKIIRKNSATSRMLKITSENSDEIQIQCSIGTYGDNCLPCPAGTYGFDYNKCTPCPTGTYSEIIGAVSLYQCTICPYKTFNDIEGSTFCKQCNSYEFCPLGVTSPLNESIISDSEILGNSQPALFQSSSKKVTNIFYSMLYFLGISSVLFTFLIIFSTSLRKKIDLLDIFTDKHEKTLGKPLIPVKTRFGGFVSVLFILTAGVFVCNSFCSFTLNNITETKSLIPLTLLDKEIYAKNFQIIFKFYIYGDYCEANDKCGVLLMIKEENIKYTTKKLVCKTEKTIQGKNCRISIQYEDFAINYESYIGIESHELYSFASFILVYVSSDSSIPNEKSAVQYLIEPDDKTTVFKGPVPTEISVQMTPSIFQSDSSDWPSEELGYHLSKEKSLIKGSTTDEKGILIIEPLIVNVKLIQSENLLLTKRSLKLTIFSVLSTLLGLIFGLLEAFAVLVLLFENRFDYINKKLAGKRFFEKLIENQKTLLSNFKMKKKIYETAATRNMSKVCVEKKYQY